MKSFISHYRAFRNQIFEECGDMEEDNIILLYSLYLENKHTVNPLAGIESFLNQYTSLFSPPNLDPTMKKMMMTHSPQTQVVYSFEERFLLESHH